MIVEATGKVMQVLSKIEGVSAKTGKAGRNTHIL